MSFFNDWQKEREEMTAIRAAWKFGDYAKNPCPKCGRQRLVICANGKHLCEKCGWSPELGEYFQLPY